MKLHCRSSTDCRTSIHCQALVVELAGHVCALQTRQQVASRQSHHDASCGVGGAADMWQHDCTRQKEIRHDAYLETARNHKSEHTWHLLTAVFQCEEGVVRRKGLGCCHIESSSSDLSRGQSLVKIFLVHHSSPEACGFNSVHAQIKLAMFIWSKVSQDLLEFTKTAVLFIFLKKVLSHIPCVSGVREQEITTKSLSARRVSMATVGVYQRKVIDNQIWGKRNYHYSIQFYCISSYQTLLSPQQLQPWLFAQSTAASAIRKAWVCVQWPCLHKNSNHTLVRLRALAQCDMIIQNPSCYQCVLVQRFPLCCQTGHNHTSREASMSSSHHWERERSTPAQATTHAIGSNVNVNVKSSTHFLTSSIPSGNLRAVASSRATVSSAVASVRTSGVYPTRIPLIKTNNKII